MILSAHQPVYLPWLGLFHKIALADFFIVFDQVQYVPKDWISRNEIKGPNGKILLTVPVLTKDHRTKKIIDIEINNETPWKKKHWMSIQQCYKKTKFFNSYSDFFEDVYSRDWVKLSELNFHMLKWFLDTLGIKTPVRSAGEFDFIGTKSDLVLDMCIKLKADQYIFGAQGAQYADQQKFRENGIRLYFQSYTHPTYSQLYGEFLPNLSVLDLLFSEGQAALDMILSCNATQTEVRMIV